ncbi:acyltransferase [Solibacillus silvestris]
MNKIKRLLINTLGASYIIPSSIRKKIYTLAGLNVQNVREIRARCFFHSENVKLGNRVFINMYTQFHSGYDENAIIEIGDDTFVGMNVNFCTISHEIGDSSRRAGKDLNKGIKVGKGVWIGANAVILPGIAIEDGCIIAAGSIVTKNCKENGLYGGNPAKRIKDL